MRARPNLSGEQMVTEYMTRVAQAATRLLPKGARAAFVGRTRALVQREIGPPGTRTDPEHVSEVLTRLGKPEDLVIEERTRIDKGWVKSRAGSREAGEAAAAALTGPRMNRPLTARRRPNSDAQPLFGRTAQQGEDKTVIGPDGTVIGAAGPSPGTAPRRSVLRPGPRGTGPWPAGLRGLRGTGPQGAGPRSGGAQDAGARRLRSADSPGTGTQGADPHAAPGGTGPAGPLGRLIGQIPGKRPASGADTFASSAGQFARNNLLETIAVLFLGLGGLILPFAFWPIGAIVALFSRIWDVKDKSVAVVGPLLVTLAASVLAAVFVGGSGNVVVAYFHAVHVDFGLMMRVGAVITAAYLVWRVTRGPRAKVPPWKRIRR